MGYTSEGKTWTPSTGMRHGLPTIGAVEPLTQFASPKTDIYDVIVVGAGYAGLVASRDLATQGKKTLLVEARDRLGGRTWHSTINGFNYEMGGAWVHWHMPHIYREISLYGLQDDWITTQNPGGKENYCTITTGNKQRNVSHEEEMDLCGRTFRRFCNLDGEDLKNTLKYVFGTKQVPELLAQWDSITCQDRLDQLVDNLTPEERTAIEAQIIQMGGNSPVKMSLLDALRWWSLGSHSPTGLNEIALHTRLGSGQSELHRRIFSHAIGTGHLSYIFECPIKAMDDAGDIVSVHTRDGQTFRARSVICTVPLNVLPSVQFVPSLPQDKISALKKESVNRCNKIHVDVNGPEYCSWSALASPGKGLVTAFGDTLTPAGNTHLVAFGPDPSCPQGLLADSGEAIVASVKHLLPEDKRGVVHFNRIVTHDWNNDEFSNGAWFIAPPKLTTQYLKVLQRPHGNIFFASADWSDGWRGWIDGAVHIGAQTAHRVIELQRVAQSVKTQHDAKL